MIGIIGAMNIEVDGIEALMSDKKVEEISGMRFAVGKIHNKEVVAVVCGIGKVNAAMCAQAMIMKYKPECIINSGVAGCLANGFEIGDIVVASDVVQHDVDTSPLGDPIGMISGINLVHIKADERLADILRKCVSQIGINCVYGTIASGDQFINNNGKKTFIAENFGALACEMEGGSIGQVCLQNDVKFGVLRAISDGADNGSNMDYPKFAKLAAENSIKVIDLFIERV